MSVRSVDPRTGEAFGPELVDTDPDALDGVLAAAASAAAPWAATVRASRAAALRSVANRLDAAAGSLIPLADHETGLGLPRLTGELARTTFQLRMFATLLESPDFLSPRVDDAVAGPLPAGHPELRRVLVALGPVAVFGASNFPFAFSVAGGDTASALAAGCPVVAKAHPAHPQLSDAVATEVVAGLADAGAPTGVFALVHGFEAGGALVTDPRVKAAAFTGSYEGGRALFDLASRRPDPIPFYGELGSVNPVFVTRAAAERGVALVEEYLDSLTLGAGQFCTNPSILVVPRGLLDLLSDAGATRVPGVFLTAGVASLHTQRLASLTAVPGARVLVAASGSGDVGGFAAPLTLVAFDAESAIRNAAALQVECFGPAGIVVEYDTDEHALEFARCLHGCLVAVVHGQAGEPLAAAFVRLLADVAGRVVWNGWPTGVAVTVAQHHGGPFPATTSPLHTSVGAAAAERFVRPVVFQSMPPHMLPPIARS